MNLRWRYEHYNTVECRRSEPRGNERRGAGYQLCWGMIGVILCKLLDFKRVQDAGGVFKTRGKKNGGGGGKKGYIYLGSCNVLVQLVLLVNEHNTTRPSCCTTTRHLMNKGP
jgi:hypothetical protein